MTREERTKLIKHLKYNRSIGADYLITDKDADEIIKALEQEQKYCDRNICTSNEYNDIGCDECEVTKSQKRFYSLVKMR